MNLRLSKLTTKILDDLPVEEGLVTMKAIADDRTWFVEFPGQTITLKFMFDDNEEHERAYADLIANGFALLSYFFNDSLENVDLLKAFQVTFNSLMKKIGELEDQVLLDEAEKEKDENKS